MKAVKAVKAVKVDDSVPVGLEDDGAADEGPSNRRRPHPIIKLAIGVVAGGVAVWLVVSAAGGIGDAFDAVRRMRGSFVVLAVGIAAARLGLYGLQLAWLGRRSGQLGLGTALGLAGVIYGFGAVTPAAPAEGLTLASRELRRRGRTKRQARLTLGLSEWFAQRRFYAVAAIPALLARFGVPLDDALAATIVYRAAGTLLPAIGGGFAIATLRAGRV